MSFLEKIRAFINDAQRYLTSLTPRERTFLGAGSGALILFIVLVSALGLSRAIARREVQIEERTGYIRQIAALAKDFRAQESDRQEMERKLMGANVRLFSYMEELARRKNVTIGDMADRGVTGGDGKIKETSVDVNMPRISLSKLADFLSEIERGPGIIKVKKLRVRGRYDTKEELDVSVTVATYQVG